MIIYRDVKDRGDINICVDEFLIDEVNRTNEVIWRFYGPKPCVYIGRFQSAEMEVDLKKCKSDNIPVFRRATGGGAVYANNELTYTVCLPLDNPLIAGLSIGESYKVIIDIIIAGLRSLGVNASFKPINDILVDGKKVSGNAQTRKNGVLLQHGTLLLDVDVDLMFSYLKVPDEKLKYKYVQSVKSLVVGINSFLDKPLKFEEARDFFVDFIVNYFKSENPLVLDLPKQLKDNAKVEYGKRYFDNAWHLKF